MGADLYKKTPKQVKTAALYSTGFFTLIFIAPVVLFLGLVGFLTSFFWLPPLALGIYIANLGIEKFFPSLNKKLRKYQDAFWDKLLFNSGVI